MSVQKAGKLHNFATRDKEGRMIHTNVIQE